MRFFVIYADNMPTTNTHQKDFTISHVSILPFIFAFIEESQLSYLAFSIKSANNSWTGKLASILDMFKLNQTN